MMDDEKLPEFIANFCFVPEYRVRALDLVYNAFVAVKEDKLKGECQLTIPHRTKKRPLKFRSVPGRNGQLRTIHLGD